MPRHWHGHGSGLLHGVFATDRALVDQWLAQRAGDYDLWFAATMRVEMRDGTEVRFWILSPHSVLLLAGLELDSVEFLGPVEPRHINYIMPLVGRKEA